MRNPMGTAFSWRSDPALVQRIGDAGDELKAVLQVAGRGVVEVAVGDREVGAEAMVDG